MGLEKSTLIKAITGAITPDEGEIIYLGKKYTELNLFYLAKLE